MKRLYVNTRFFAAVLLALSITIIPLPEPFSVCRPLWLLLLLLYTQFYLPNYYTNPFFILLIGSVYDVLASSIMGEHACALLLTLWLSSNKMRRFRFFSSPQQLIVMLSCFIFYQFIIFLIDAGLGYHYDGVMMIASIFLSLFVWIWVRQALHRLFFNASTW